MTRLGLLLCTAPAEGDLPVVSAVALAALAAGHQVGLFLMDDAVAYVHDPRLQPLLDAGVDATVCATDAAARGLSEAQLSAAGLRAGSQRDHARLLRDSDRFLAFT